MTALSHRLLLRLELIAQANSLFVVHHCVVVAVLNPSGISSYMFSPVVSSIGTEASGKESSGIRLYSAYGEITAKI